VAALTYALPVESLQSLAQAAGLEWVGSDPDKVAQAQAAMAAEPAPVRVQRAPRAVVQVDEGPLVLVETRQDLTQLTLPFDPPAAAGSTETRA
jgi:ribonuclease E